MFWLGGLVLFFVLFCQLFSLPRPVRVVPEDTGTTFNYWYMQFVDSQYSLCREI